MGGAGAAGADFYNFLSSALGSAVAATGAPQEGGSSGAAAGAGMVIPGNLQGAEKASFIAAQRERIAAVLGALDSEARSLEREETLRAEPAAAAEEGERPPSGLSSWSGLSKSRSEVEFEKIDAESGGEEEDTVRRRKGGGGGSWMPFGWGVGPEGESSGGAEKKEK